MKAISIIPGIKNSVHLRDVPIPNIADSEILIHSLYAGICGTDREINQGFYGQAPKSVDYLILGHESFGVIEKVGKNVSNFVKGQYVVRAVRRSCNHCANCLNGANDLCATGDFVESGIKELHGCMAEYFKDSPNYLIPIPKEFANVAVLLEPLSVVEKVLRHANYIQTRVQWKPQKAMIIGAGPIGILQAMLFIKEHMDVYVIARSSYGNLKSRLVESIGAKYISTDGTTLENILLNIGRMDFVVDASGDSKIAFEAMNGLNNNGVLCLTSITGGNRNTLIPSDKINLDLVLGNKLVFGSVNANIIDYINGVKTLGIFMNLWPKTINAMFTRKISLDQYNLAFVPIKDDIKTIIDMSY